MNLLRVAILPLLLNLFVFSVAYKSKEQTLVLNPILRMSSRRKRSLLLPNYGSIKITAGLAKGIIGNNPKGLSLSYEICSYFAGPTVISDLLNEIKLNKPKQRNIYKTNKTKNLRHWPESIRQRYPNMSDTYFNEPNHNEYKQHPAKVYVFDPLKVNNPSLRSGVMHKIFERSSTASKFDKSGIINMFKKSPLQLALDFLFGSNAKCGILKTICMSKEFLMSPGYSMIHDIVRIVAFGALGEKFFSGEREGISEICENNLYSDCEVEKNFTS